jgi:predicted solute-binding protein
MTKASKSVSVPETKPVVTAVATNKAEKARAIFKECYAMPQVPQRKDIIQRAVVEVGLTTKGAATYLQNYRNKQGMVQHKAASAVAVV